MVRILSVGVLALVLLSSRADAWPWSSCCDKEGWYALDGGPLSWYCSGGRYRIGDVRTYLDQGDYEAAKRVATELIDRNYCVFIGATPPDQSQDDLYVFGKDSEHAELPDGMTYGRLKGTETTGLIFRTALTADGAPRDLNENQRQFVAWATETMRSKLHPPDKR